MFLLHVFKQNSPAKGALMMFEPLILQPKNLSLQDRHIILGCEPVYVVLGVRSLNQIRIYMFI